MALNKTGFIKRAVTSAKDH